MLSENTLLERRPLIVEIVGPAGAGKTTLLRALRQRQTNILTGVRPCTIRDLPSCISVFFILLSTLCPYRHHRWFTWREMRSMVYLKAWYQDIIRQKQAPSDDLATILDHGPIYRLAMLGEFGPDLTKNPLYARWWDTMLNQWAGVLEMIIWLDARDAVLLERIHVRNDRHVIKGKSEQEASDFLVRYRRSYEGIITKMTADNGPVLLCFDTNQISLDQIVDAVLSAINSKLTTN